MYKITKCIVKRTFYNLMLMYDLDYKAFKTIAEMAQVPVSVVEAMFLDNTVLTADATNVLAAFSEYTGHHWTLNTVTVKTAHRLTFKDICTLHLLDLDTLAKEAGVPFAVLDRMLDGEPVSEKEAQFVMQMVSRQSEHIYRLEEVDVKLMEEEAQHE